MRSTRQITKAIVIGLSSAVIAWFAGASAFATIAAKSNPDRALRLAANNADALAIKADALLIQSRKAGASELAASLARDALKAQAVHGRALRIVASTVAGSDQSKVAASLIGLSSNTTRRDLGARIWLIENNVARGDVAGALREYDIALRTNAQGQVVLFPVLSSALNDPQIRAEFVGYLRQPPPWLAPFLDYAVDQGSDVSSLSRVLRTHTPSLSPAFLRRLNSRLIVRLADRGDYRELAAFYQAAMPGRRQVLTEAAFDAQSTDPQFVPVSWQVLPSSVIVGSFDAEGPGSSMKLQVTAAPSARGVVARKLLLLTPGLYQLQVRYGFAEGAAGSMLALVVGCKSADGDRVVLNSPLVDRSAAARALIDFSIPEECVAQYLSVEAAGGAGQTDASMVLNSLRVMSR